MNLFAALALVFSSAGSAPLPIALEHVHVIPMDREIVLRDHTVVVRDGAIAALGPSSDIAVPADAQRIDCGGAYLMPGLADMHVHTWFEDELTLFVANGVTTVRNMFGSPVHLEWRRKIEAGELLGPRIYTAGPIVDGEPPIWPESDVLTDAANADALVQAQHAAGYDFIKCYAMLSPAAYDALIASAKKHDMRVMGHVPAALDVDRVLRAGQTTIEHLDGYAAAAQAEDSSLAGKVSFWNETEAWERVDPARLKAAAERTAAAGTWNCPTIVVFEKRASGALAREWMKRPEMRFVPAGSRDAWDPDKEMSLLGQVSDSFTEAQRRSCEARRRAVGALHAAGARIVLGTDQGNPFVLAGFAVHDELDNLVRAGLSPYEALRAATSGAAECMGASEEWGRVAVGRRADLVLVEGNPLENVRVCAKPKGVMVRGRWLAAQDIERELERVASRNAPAAKETR